jgi:hypothetical protein
MLLEGGRPQAKLNVNLLNSAGTQVAKTQTSDDGSFHFADQPPGEYLVASSKEISQRHGTSKATVVAGQTTTVTVNLGL